MTVPEMGIARKEDGRPRLGKSTFSNPTELEELLTRIYSDKIGYEIAHVDSAEERSFLYEAIESLSGVQAASGLQRRMAKVLLESETFDHFMGKRFGQVKRYGLEGGEGMMVAVDVLLHLCRAQHVVIGMPHRGRLNLMVGLLGYPAAAIFHKLTGACELPAEWKGSADVLSHLSHTGEIAVGDTKKIVSILPNPSHLEAINPVQQGAVYALQNSQGQEVLPLQIHGDAAFSGQGIVQETFQMSQLSGFAVGGTIHLIVNNQLGYTATPEVGRSACYASAPAKIVGAPIFHVNGDAPAEVARVMSLALQYRERFGKDVVVDLICYRRHGHNELDEPGFTQPLMYRAVQAKTTLPQAYSAELVDNGVIQEADIAAIKEAAFSRLDQALNESKSAFTPVKFGLQKDVIFPPPHETGVSRAELKAVGEASVSLPHSFNVHSRLQKYHIDARFTQIKEGTVDWATAESMAIGTLLAEGFRVRLVGQDVQRGTFSQRHFVFHDQQNGERTIPFANWSGNKGALEVVNSHLSELAVLGFEYGASIVEPIKMLPIWEAQFGDFFNGAQIVLDTFVGCGETKWGLQSPIVMLLPHGYDGTGPEHSSCRMERFLQMCNAPHDPRVPFEPNWRIVHPTTPANYFHLLRRQVLGGRRLPLVVAAPKVLLRLPAAQSPLSAMEKDTSFLPLIDDPRNPQKVNRVIFCTGKFYYEIEKERASRNLENVAIVRIEELCPLPTAQLDIILQKYHKATQFVWCQEEHRNMGAYDYIAPRLGALLNGKELCYVGREVAATPAAGYSQLHKAELAAIWTFLF
jgi:probable 2-oxoglutarate dehydrogenase E1 component DHKTD1